MKNSYPIILTPDSTGYVVDIPDFQIGTQGDSIPEAMEMARDAIGLMGIDMEDDGKTLPPALCVGKRLQRSRGHCHTGGCGLYRVPPAERYADGAPECVPSLLAQRQQRKKRV